MRDPLNNTVTLEGWTNSLLEKGVLISEVCWYQGLESVLISEVC